MKYYLAIDIGASSDRHIVGWRKGETLETKEVYRFPNGVKEENGHLTWDLDRLLREVHGKMPFSELYRRTGCQFQPFNALYQLYDDQKKGRLEGVTDFLMTPSTSCGSSPESRQRSLPTLPPPAWWMPKPGSSVGTLLRHWDYLRNCSRSLVRRGLW